MRSYNLQNDDSPDLLQLPSSATREREYSMLEQSLALFATATATAADLMMVFKMTVLPEDSNSAKHGTVSQ